MKKVHRSFPVFFKSSTANIDSENGVIRDIVIIQSGKDKYGENFDGTFLKQIAHAGNAQPQGVKSRYGHPNMCDSSLGSFLGRYKNFRVGANADGKPVALADLHLDSTAKNSPKGNLYDYVVEMTQKNSDMFGNSIVYMPDEPELIREKSESGNEVDVPYQRLKSFLASDLVDSPAATDSLFKDTDDFAALATNFLEENPHVYELISKNDNVLNDFLTKYKHFKNHQSMTKKKSFIEKIKALVNDTSEEKSYDATTADGKVVTIDNPSGSGTPEKGDVVTDDAGAPVASQTLTLDDGTVIVTDADGKITDVTAAEANPVADAETESAKELKELKEKHETLQKEYDDFKAEIEIEREETVKEVNKLKAKIKSDYVLKTGQTNLKRDNKKETDPKDRNRVLEAKEKFAKKKEEKK
jgi:hypothetical protein